MAYEFYSAINRIPISMNVSKAHENRYLDAFVVKILVFFHFLNYHHLTVAGSNNYFICSLAKQADGATEEIYYNTIDDDASAKDNVKSSLASNLLNREIKRFDDFDSFITVL